MSYRLQHIDSLIDIMHASAVAISDSEKKCTFSVTVILMKKNQNSCESRVFIDRSSG